MSFVQFVVIVHYGVYVDSSLDFDRMVTKLSGHIYSSSASFPCWTVHGSLSSMFFADIGILGLGFYYFFLLPLRDRETGRGWWGCWWRGGFG